MLIKPTLSKNIDQNKYILLLLELNMQSIFTSENMTIDLKLYIIELLINSNLTLLEIAELTDIDEEFVALVKIEISN
jgi:hypothetical protein